MNAEGKPNVRRPTKPDAKVKKSPGENKCTSLYRILNGLKPGILDHLFATASAMPAGAPDPWSENKLRATPFLNADADIQKECISRIALPEGDKNALSSEKAVSLFCLTQQQRKLLIALYDSDHFTAKDRDTMNLTHRDIAV